MINTLNYEDTFRQLKANILGSLSHTFDYIRKEGVSYVFETSHKPRIRNNIQF